LRYIEFLLPGLIALSVMQMSVFSVAFVFTQYKEKGVLKRLLATPMKPLQFVAANAITRLIVSVVQAAIFIVMGILLFKVHIIGSYWLLHCALCLVRSCS
jgi:ABC-2 type transport system permease protein